MNEIKELSTQGVILKIGESGTSSEENIHMRAHLLLASGDVPGVADLIHHKGNV